MDQGWRNERRKEVINDVTVKGRGFVTADSIAKKHTEIYWEGKHKVTNEQE